MARLPINAYNIIKTPLQLGKFKVSALNSLRNMTREDIMQALLKFQRSGFKTGTLRAETTKKKKCKTTNVSTYVKNSIVSELM